MVKVELLLHAAARNPEGVGAVAAWCAAHGLTVTGTGIAAVTALASEDGFLDLFGSPASERSVPSAELAGWQNQEYRVPATVQSLVASIHVAPQHGLHR